MGGRGSAGLGKTSRRSDVFTAPAMSGSEKQIDYAKDIAENPYKSTINLAKTAERLHQDTESEVYREAAAQYKTLASQAISKQYGGQAKMVIENKSEFAYAMNELIKMAGRKRGMKPYQLQTVRS